MISGTTISIGKERACYPVGPSEREGERRSAYDSPREYEKEEKSERGMPRLPEARKDVVSCEKPRGSANRK